MPTAWPAKTVLKLIFFVPQTDAAAVGNHAWIVYQAIFWRDSYIAIVDH
jgi:hypothetical protein